MVRGDTNQGEASKQFGKTGGALVNAVDGEVENVLKNFTPTVIKQKVMVSGMASTGASVPVKNANNLQK